MPAPERRERGDPQDLVITLLATNGRAHPGAMWSGGLVQVLREFGFSTAAARAALSRLVRRGLLRRIRNGRLAFYEITERCAELLREGDERILTLGTRNDWDETWTIVWHSIPETEPVARNRMARRLRFLGFRSLQDGIWISPHSRDREVVRVVRDLSVEEHVGVLLGRPVPELRIDELIKRGWDLDDLAVSYERFVAEFAEYESAARRRHLTDLEAFLVRARAAHTFAQFPFLDPDVPDELMPRSEVRRRAAATFHAIFEDLAEPAQRYFDAVTGMEPSGGAS
jgi:phenylacetic acid degradation operon negative regulatory protein